MTTNEKKVTNRNSRESEAHDNNLRSKPWRPVRNLEAPPAPPGMTYRWIRTAMLGQEDRSNVSRRIREGWELVRLEELPAEWQHMSTTEVGKETGIINNEGLVLGKMPTEMVDQRNEYYQQKNLEQVEALDNTVFNDSRKDGRYVKYNPQRDTKVTFGKQ